ncbi:MAG: peptidoglycan-binding protein [Aestuariivirga sp.]|uniref:peptidoglycan-binding domain-containing protein n=1 Tax=Aestuariivirga sp. TaxID=2650926 RepID=UPI0025B83305|nr:peptidoglycan-binding domain-containing protein [Aestuariivirga sp.]MCA3561514.1 peptidoglycan-binding protein [Aestuariivirga sp.]
MREMVEKQGRRVRIVPLAAWSLTAVMSAAIAGNALFGQNAPGRAAQAAIDPATDAAGDIVPSGGRTIQLKFDPVVEAVQRELLSAGYYKGPVDGVNGRKTRQAIAAYQQAMGLEANGQPSGGLAEHIRFTREVSEASLFTGTVTAAPGAEQRAAIRRVQTGLADLAYSPGAINGELTRETRDAIIAFQRDHGLNQTGEVSDGLIAELAKVSGQAEAGSGAAAQ